MKRLLPALLLPVLAGCLSPAKTPSVANWVLTPRNGEKAVVEKPVFGETRLAVVYVRSPYDGRPLTVLRDDGSVAFDPYNQFASVPAALIKGTALDVLRSTGLFAGVQPAITTADVKANLELVVDELSLDCRAEGARKASVKLILAMVKDRQVVMAEHGASTVDAADGNYSAAFGTAFARALFEAASKFAK